MEKKKATKNVWIYQEDYDYIATKVKYGTKFADALNKILEVRDECDEKDK
jgi:hypothetical protein